MIMAVIIHGSILEIEESFALNQNYYRLIVGT